MRFKTFYLKETENTIPKILYHGSNYDFSKFDLKFVGKGEGLQKFGYGIYLTDTEELSNFYATQLKGTQIIYQCRIPSDSRLYEWGSPVDDYLHNKYIRYLNDNDFEKDAEKLQDEYEQYNEYMEFENYYKILSHLVGSPKKSSEIFVELGVDGCISDDIKNRGKIYVIFDTSLIKIIDKEILNESEEQSYFGYKIVNFDGKDAYSIADKKVKYPLKKNSTHTGNIYLGTSKKYATEYYSTDSDDPEDPEELLLTYEFFPSDIKKGNLDDKDYMTGGSEIIVSKAKLVNVYNITKKKTLIESEEQLNEASQEYNIAKVLADKIIRTLRDMAHYDLTHLDRYFKKYKDHRNDLYKIPMSDFMKDIKVPEGGVFDYLKKGHVFLENGYLEKGDKTPWLYSDDSKTRKAGGYFDQHKDYFGIHLPFIDTKTKQPFRGYFTEFKSLIIHELTHFIQGSKEKFISGTASLSSGEWYSNKKEQEAYLHELYNDFQNFVEDTLRDMKSYRYADRLSNANYKKYVSTSNMLYKMFESLETFKKSVRVLEKRIFLDNPKNRDRFLYLSTELRDVYNKFLEDSYYELKKEFKNMIPTKELKYEKES